MTLTSGPMRKVLARPVMHRRGNEAQARKGLAQIVDLEGLVPGLHALHSPVVSRTSATTGPCLSGVGCEKVPGFFMECLPSWGDGGTHLTRRPTGPKSFLRVQKAPIFSAPAWHPQLTDWG